MIEVEKKFLLTPEQEMRLIKGAEFVGEKTIIDSYYDTTEYAITLANRWLRQRGDEFELKVPAHVSDDRTVDQYRELTEWRDIRRELGLPEDDIDAAQALKKAGYERFMSPRTTRRTYRKDGFTIDLDIVTYEESDFRYGIAEIERLVESESDMPAAIDEIITFAKQHGLITDQFILGKVGAFLKSERPDHYAALVAAEIF